MAKYDLKTRTKTKETRNFKEGFEEFLKNCYSKNVSNYTIRYYGTLKYTLDMFCDMDKIMLNDIDKQFFNDYVLFHKERGIKDATILSYCKGLRSMLYYFMEKGYMKEFKIDMPKSDVPVKNIYTNSEIEKLLKIPDFKTSSFSTIRSWAMVVYFVGTGQRLRTVLGLKIEDINLEDAIVTLKNVKNRKHTILPLSYKVVDALKIYLSYRGGKGNEFLFCSWEGLELSKRGAEEAIRRYNKSRGVEKTSIHAFRHSFATNYLEAGGDLFRLQKLLCHSNINVTKEYIHLTTKGLGKDLDDLTYLSNVSFRKIKVR